MILSHDHYDHGGGLKTFAAGNESKNIYATEVFGAYAKDTNGAMTEIGLDKACRRIVLCLFKMSW